MATPEIVPELLTRKQTAATLAVSERTLMRLVDEGRAPPPIKLRPGERGTVRWARSRLLRWIADGCPPCGENGNGTEG